MPSRIQRDKLFLGMTRASSNQIFISVRDKLQSQEQASNPGILPTIPIRLTVREAARGFAG